MKKLKLSELGLGNAEVLSREQLKKVLGGLGSGGGSSSGTCRAHYLDASGFDMYTDCESKSKAQQDANEFVQYYGNGHWCCESCPIEMQCP